MLRLAAALLLALAAPAKGQPVWTEEATSETRDGVRPWANPSGDWLDAAGTPLGAKPFASAAVARRGLGPVRLDVTEFVRRYGGDFRVNSTGAVVKIAAREAPDGGGATLEVTAGPGTRRLAAVADTAIRIGRPKPAGANPQLDTRTGILVRFDQPADPAITRATLIIPVLKVYGKAGRLLVFRPVALERTAALAAGASFAPPLPRPDRDRRSGRPGRDRPAAGTAFSRGSPASIHGQRPGRTLISVRGADLKPRPNSRVDGDVFVGAIERSVLAAVNDVRSVPGSPASAYMTVVLRLSPDFSAYAGKLPGLSNTGLGRPPGEKCQAGDKLVGRGGWGGRKADGCHWSARTQYKALGDGTVRMGSYAYALAPKGNFGQVDPWNLPIPKGRWFAFVQWVRVNDPGRDNGEMAHWLVDRQLAPGGRQVESAGGIRWRSAATPDAQINEAWINVYCGGRNCGPAPWPRSEVRVKRVTVTTELPNLAAIQAELDRLNARG